MGQLNGMTALVTGGNSGIGLAAAKRLAANGAHVFLTGRNQDTINQAVSSIGPSATGIQRLCSHQGGYPIIRTDLGRRARRL